MLRHVPLLALLLPAIALADSPTELPVQGVLTDPAGLPIDGVVPVSFALYADTVTTAPLFEEQTSLDVQDGHFVAYLGRVNVLDWAIARDNGSLYLGIAVDGDEEMERIPIATTAFAGWADYSGNAATVDGFDVNGLIGEVEASIGDGVHDRYTDDEAVAAMGDTDATNALNHARYTDAEAVAAMGANGLDNPLHHDRFREAEARAAMGNVRHENPYAHDRFSTEEVIAALGDVANDNPNSHNRYTDAEALAAMGTVANTNPYAHNRYTDGEARDAMGAIGNTNPYAHSRFSADEALGAVASQDWYLRNTTDTLDGNLTVTGQLRDDNSPLGVHMIKMAFHRTDDVLYYTPPDGVVVQVPISGTQRVNSERVVFVPSGTVHGDGVLYFNIEGSPSIACTLLHSEDDTARRGYYFATDSGNNKVAVWNNDNTRTFELAREGETGWPIANHASFQFICF